MPEIKELTEFKRRLQQNFIIDDLQAVDLIMAIAAAHKIPGEMLWVRIIGASGTGKTEILRTLASQKDYCETFETLTPSAIRRGYISKDTKSAKNTPMLERIDGKLVITKEFAPLLTRDKTTQTEIFGLLRAVHDGELDADYGSDEGHLKQTTHFDWIVGATSYVERQRQLDQLLGTRYLDLRWGAPIDTFSAVKQAINNDPKLPEIRKDITQAATNLIGAIDSETKLPEYSKAEWLIEIAIMTATLRTWVPRDGNHNISELPEKESGTRLGQSLARVAKGLQLLDIDNLIPYIVRLAWDCMPPIRASVLKAIIVQDLKTQEEIARVCHISQPTVGTVLEDLVCLGVFNSTRDHSSPYNLSLLKKFTPIQFQLPVTETEYKKAVKA